MIALDTNVLVRLLVNDEPTEVQAARALLDHAVETGVHVFVSSVVLCETAWVLRSTYRMHREAVVTGLAWVLAAHPLVVESRVAASRALTAYATGRGDFADYLIRETARAHGAHAIATFDRALYDDDGFVPPSPDAWPEPPSLRELPPPYRLRIV